MSDDVRKRLDLLSGLVKGLRDAVRVNDFRVAHHLRIRLAAAMRQVEKPLRDEIEALFEISGLWVRNGNRHDTKRQIQQLIRRIIPRLRVRRWR